jgi:hypothetical protein
MSPSPSNSPTTPVFPKGPTNPSPQNLLGFVSSTPAPVTRILVELSGVIEWLLWFARVVNWRGHSASESWLVVIAWCTLCLMFEYAIK